MELVRSAMFVPGHRARFVDKALGGLAADAIMLDLEDGVPPPEKAGGRALVAAAAAANVQALDGVWPDIQDAAGLARDCALARELGFTGKSLIHPGQIEPINAAFSPGADEIAYAERVVAAFEAAQAQGE